MSVIAKVIRRITSAFKEKPVIEPDDFELEHFLLYHGLVGSSPENQRKFKDVKADIEMAMDENSPTLLAIALKLPPLWWTEKLESIFKELDRNKAIEILAPHRHEGDSDVNNSIPLFHQHWKVRSNAARMLAFLNAREKAGEIIDSLHDATGDTKLSFPHLAHSLAALEAEEAGDAIGKYLLDEDPWMRVDAASAYSALRKEAEDERLIESILTSHLLFDYQAVQITKNIPLTEFLNSKNEKTRAAAHKLISGVIHALTETFASDIHLEKTLEDIAPILVQQAGTTKQPLLIRAIFDFKNWMEVSGSSIGSFQERKEMEELLSSRDVATSIKDCLDTRSEKSSLEASQIEAAIYLTGALELKQHADLLTEYIDEDSPYLEEVLDAVYKLGATDEKCAQKLRELLHSLVDLEKRTGLEFSAQPVMEDSSKKAKLYWRVLRALASDGSDKTIDLLLKASRDYASDKRNQAIKSLIQIEARKESSKREQKVLELVQNSLTDGSLEVRFSAVDGVAKLEIIEALSKILDMTKAKEVSLAQEALRSLSELAGVNKELVVDKIQAKLKTVHNQYYRDKLTKVLENIDR